MNKLSMYRKQAGIKQKELAAKLGICNKKMNTMERPDFDLKSLSFNTLERICEILNIKISDLVGAIE